MTSATQIAWDDTVLPFQLDRSHIRGRIIRLDGALESVLHQHDYPPEIKALLAETTLLCALIGQSIKLRWKLSLQVRGKGPARLIAADYQAPQSAEESARIRAYASYDAARLTSGSAPFEQIGEGYLAVMLDQGQGTAPYQGFTPIAGGSLAACAEAYFAQSEQLATRFSLAIQPPPAQPEGAHKWRGGGVMLQHMPPASGAMKEPAPESLEPPAAPQKREELLRGADGENWRRANLLLDTAEPAELIGPQVSQTELLLRLFHEEGPRVFTPQPVRFGCSCSEEKVRQTMSIYSQKDIAKMTDASGKVTADCQFCGAHYALEPESLGFEGRPGGPEA